MKTELLVHWHIPCAQNCLAIIRYLIRLPLNDRMMVFLKSGILKVWSASLGGPQFLSRNPQSQNYFHNNIKKISAFSTVLTFVLWYKSNVGRIAGILAPIKAVAPNYPSSRCIILHCHVLAVKKKKASFT